MGPAYCGLVLIRCAQAGRRAVEAVGGWVRDVWYMDDGAIVMDPRLGVPYLRAFDRISREKRERQGISRSYLSGVPSNATPINPSEAKQGKAKQCEVGQSNGRPHQ